MCGFFDTYIRIDSEVEWAQDNSLPVYIHKKSARSAAEYFALAKEMDCIMSVGTGSIKRAAAKAGEAKGKTPAATVKTAVKPAGEKAATGAKAATKPKSAAAKKNSCEGRRNQKTQLRLRK